MKTKATHAVCYIIARGVGAGIVDMMRYDNAVPANESEASVLETAMLYTRDGESWIIFRRFYASPGDGAPTVERWRSFGWECAGPYNTYGEANDARIARS